MTDINKTNQINVPTWLYSYLIEIQNKGNIVSIDVLKDGLLAIISLVKDSNEIYRIDNISKTGISTMKVPASTISLFKIDSQKLMLEHFFGLPKNEFF